MKVSIRTMDLHYRHLQHRDFLKKWESKSSL